MCAGVSEEQAYGGPSGERTMGDFFENMGNTEVSAHAALTTS